MRFSIPRFWREIPSRYRLKATRCLDCGKINYPPSNVCRYCGSRNVEEYELNHEKAKLLTWTKIHIVPNGFEERKPLIIGIVETIETKTRILVPITDVLENELHEGMLLEPVLRRISEDSESGIIHYAIAYRPVLKG